MEHIYTIRPLKDADSYRMLEWMRNENATQYLQIGGKGTTIDSVQRFIATAQEARESLHRAIVDERDIYYGTVSLKHINREKGEAEYAIAMHMDGMGTGAARQGSEQIFALAAQLRLTRLYLYVQADNVRAIRFYEKMGWRRFTGHDELNNGCFWFERMIEQTKEME